MTPEQKADLLLEDLNVNEAIDLCDDMLEELGYGDDNTAIEEDDMEVILLIDNFLEIKKVLQSNKK